MFDLTVSISLDLIAILIILLIRFDFGYPTLNNNKNTADKIFDLLLTYSIVLVLIEIVTWVVDGRQGEIFIFLNYLSNVLLYTLNSGVCLLWLLYCFYRLGYNETVLKKLCYISVSPLILLLILISFSSKCPIFFGVNANNIYYRGEYFNLLLILSVLYIGFSEVLILYKIHTSCDVEEKRQYKILLIYPVLPIVGIFVAIWRYGLNLSWICNSISFLIVYFNLQNSQIITDPLTGINNRRRFETYAQSLLSNQSAEESIYFMLIDINDFKIINDTDGHLEGDKAIRKTALILLKSIDGSDFIARFGGDEFIIIVKRNSEFQVKKLINEINESFDKYNSSSGKKYQISVSVGYAGVMCRGEKTIDELLLEADLMMYENKRRLKK